MSKQGSVQQRFLVFIIGAEEYAMPIGRIREIIGYLPVIPFSRKQGLFQGIIPWGDELVPVMDLRMTVGGGSGDLSPDTCIVITSLPVDGEELLAGLVVDGVLEVLEVPDQLVAESDLFMSANMPTCSWGSLSDRRRSVYINRTRQSGRW